MTIEITTIETAKRKKPMPSDNEMTEQEPDVGVNVVVTWLSAPRKGSI